MPYTLQPEEQPTTTLDVHPSLIEWVVKSYQLLEDRNASECGRHYDAGYAWVPTDILISYWNQVEALNHAGKLHTS